MMMKMMAMTLSMKIKVYPCCENVSHIIGMALQNLCLGEETRCADAGNHN